MLNGRGKLQLGIGDGQGAEASFSQVERIAVGSGAKAEAALNTYRAALERRDWEGSAAHLSRAMELAPDLAPYPAHRFRMERVLGAGGFGVALQCRDTHLQLLVRRYDGDWSVRIIDFGLACGQPGRALDSKSVIGESLTGKQGYAPWEQTIPGGNIGPWSDIYSLGKLASFALFGVLEPRTRHLRTLPQPLMDLLEDCIDRDIEQRPRDAAELAGRLGALVGESGTTKPVPKPELSTPASRTRLAQAEGDLLQPVDLHGWPAAKVQDRQRRTAELIRARGLLDSERTRWVDDIAFRNLLDDGCEGPELVVVPAGSFLMGAPEGELESFGRERPQQRVQIPRPFAIGRCALTFDHYDAYCKATDKDKPNDSGWGRGTRPAIRVSWDDVSAYAGWLAERSGRSYRLPSEAEWEYAARAGTTTAFWWGDQIDTERANYNGSYTYGKGAKGEYRKQTLPVDAFDANPWGLFQVHGNVGEWCADDWHDSYEGVPTDGSVWDQPQDEGGHGLLRGGSLNDRPGWLRAAFRGGGTRGFRFYILGVRLAQDLFL